MSLQSGSHSVDQEEAMHLDTGPPSVERAGTTVSERPTFHPSVADAPADPSGQSAQGRVTVLIPTKDRPDLILRSVATALAQEGVDVEVLVVDDGSATPVSEVLAPDRRLRILRNERSQGVAAARNRGIDAAQTDWIAFLDDDDLWAPNKLARQLEAVTAANATWCHTGTLRLNGALGVDETWPIVQEETGFELLLVANLVSTPSTVMVSTAVLRDVGGFDPAFSIMADWDLWLRLAADRPAAVAPEPLVGYVIHDASMHRQNTAALRRELKAIKKKHRADGPIRSPQTWRWIARIHWDTGHRLKATPIALTAAVLYARQPWWGTDGLLARLLRKFRHHGPILAVPKKPAPAWVTRWASTDPAPAAIASE